MPVQSSTDFGTSTNDDDTKRMSRSEVRTLVARTADDTEGEPDTLPGLSEDLIPVFEDEAPTEDELEILESWPIDQSESR